MHTCKDIARIVKTVSLCMGFLLCFPLPHQKVVLKQKACLYHRATFIPFCVSVDDLLGIQASHFIQKLVIEMETLAASFPAALKLNF